MNFDANPTSSAVCYVAEYGGCTASAEVQRKWLEEVLPHFYAPAIRQCALDIPASAVVPSSLDDEVELESPAFVPAVARDFAARGFVRRNRWAAKGHQG